MKSPSPKPIIIVDEPDLSHPRAEVDSSALSHIGWDEDSRVLWVTFRQSGHSYKYLEVPASEFENLVNAPSVGKYFTTKIKPKYQCVGEQDEVFD